MGRWGKPMKANKGEQMMDNAKEVRAVFFPSNEGATSYTLGDIENWPASVPNRYGVYETDANGHQRWLSDHDTLEEAEYERNKP